MELCADRKRREREKKEENVCNTNISIGSNKREGYFSLKIKNIYLIFLMFGVSINFNYFPQTKSNNISF